MIFNHAKIIYDVSNQPIYIYLDNCFYHSIDYQSFFDTVPGAEIPLHVTIFFRVYRNVYAPGTVITLLL